MAEEDLSGRERNSLRGKALTLVAWSSGYSCPDAGEAAEGALALRGGEDCLSVAAVVPEAEAEKGAKATEKSRGECRTPVVVLSAPVPAAASATATAGASTLAAFFFLCGGVSTEDV